MTESGWHIRSMGRERIVDSLVVRHVGLAFDGVSQADARVEMSRELDNLVANGLAHAIGPSGEMRFDPVEVTNFLTAHGLDDANSLWARHYAGIARRAVEQLSPLCPTEVGALVPDPMAAEPRSFSVRLERTYNCEHLPAEARLRLRLPLPIEDDTLCGLHMDFQVPSGSQTRVDPGQLIVALPRNPGGEVSLAVHASFEARTRRPAAASLTEEELTLYTAPSEGLIKVDAQAIADAERITTGVADDFERTQALFASICANYCIGAVPYRALDPQRPLEWSRSSGFLDCQLAAAMLCAMCRALGIPARIIAGYQLYPVALAHHYWAEAWSPDRGWSSFDSIGWLVSHGGRDAAWLRVFSGALDFRIKTEILPQVFTGPSSVRLPSAWHMTDALIEQGYETSYFDAYSGALVYRDRLANVAELSV